MCQFVQSFFNSDLMVLLNAFESKIAVVSINGAITARDILILLERRLQTNEAAI